MASRQFLCTYEPIKLHFLLHVCFEKIVNITFQMLQILQSKSQGLRGQHHFLALFLRTVPRQETADHGPHEGAELPALRQHRAHQSFGGASSQSPGALGPPSAVIGDSHVPHAASAP
jgi:hypothetical protein